MPPEQQIQLNEATKRLQQIQSEFNVKKTITKEQEKERQQLQLQVVLLVQPQEVCAGTIWCSRDSPTGEGMLCLFVVTRHMHYL